MSHFLVNKDPDVFRSKITEHFSKLLENEKTGANIEKGIYNFAIKESTFRQIIKKWKNPLFCEIYSGRLRSVIVNINNNKELLEQIKSGEITPQQFAFMSHQEMSPKQWQQRIEKKMKCDRLKFTNNIEASTDMFTCGKCKSKKCTYYEMQTRSADEPTTVFITCLNCGKNWKN
jgi:transcription elongation factor S-II